MNGFLKRWAICSLIMYVALFGVTILLDVIRARGTGGFALAWNYLTSFPDGLVIVAIALIAGLFHKRAARS